MSTSDVAFAMFLATVHFNHLSSYEKRLYAHMAEHPGLAFDPTLEDQIAAYSRAKRKAA